MLAVDDAVYKLVWVDICANGAAADAQILNISELNFALADDRLPVPPPEPLPFDNHPVPFHLIGEDALALTTSLMKPFGKRKLTKEEHIFNYFLSRARRVLVVNKFRCIHYVMQQDVVKNVQLIEHACCILHIIIRARYPRMHILNMIDREDVYRELIPGDWRRHANLDVCTEF